MWYHCIPPWQRLYLPYPFFNLFASVQIIQIAWLDRLRGNVLGENASCVLICRLSADAELTLRQIFKCSLLIFVLFLFKLFWCYGCFCFCGVIAYLTVLRSETQVRILNFEDPDDESCFGWHWPLHRKWILTWIWICCMTPHQVYLHIGQHCKTFQLGVTADVFLVRSYFSSKTVTTHRCSQLWIQEGVQTPVIRIVDNKLDRSEKIGNWWQLFVILCIFHIIHTFVDQRTGLLLWPICQCLYHLKSCEEMWCTF